MRQCVPIASTVASASAQLLRSAVRSQFCQPSRTCANDCGGKLRFTASTSPVGNVAKVSEVVTPKLPPPPPRNAQNRSGWLVGGRGDRLAAGQHHRRRPQCVPHQARVPGMGAQPAAQGVARGTDRRAGARRDTPARRRQHLMHRIQTRRGRHRDLPGGGVVIDAPGQLTQVEHHRAVRGGRPHIGVPAAARSDLEVVRGSECHRLLHIRRPRSAVTTAAGVSPL